MTIPGCSQNMAVPIATKYRSLGQLMDALASCAPREGPKLLARPLVRSARPAPEFFASMSSDVVHALVSERL